jgi:hypothetical protein
MQQKALQELIDWQRRQLLLVAMGRVAPAEGDVAVFESNESVVRYGNTMQPRQNSNLPSNQADGRIAQRALNPCKTGFMIRLLGLLPFLFARFFRSRRDLLLENVALRQQLGVLKQRHLRPRFATPDKFFWVMLRRLWPGWKQALILIQPETVVRWHRAGFRLYWTWISRRRAHVGRKCISRELRELIFRMVAENPTWGAPRIHGEMKTWLRSVDGLHRPYGR